MVGTIGFEPIQALSQQFYRLPRALQLGRVPNISETPIHLRPFASRRQGVYIVSTSYEMPIVKGTVCVVSDHLNSVHFTIRIFRPTKGVSSTDPPILPMFFTVQGPDLVSGILHTILPNIGSQLCWGQQKSRLVSLAASFCKCSGYFFLVSRLLIEGSHRNRILFITWCKPYPITGAETLGG